MSDYRLDYHVWARTIGKVVVALGSSDGLQDGEWHEAAITAAPGLVDAMTGDVTRAAPVTLELALALDSPTRAAVLALPEGTLWEITCIATRHAPGAAPVQHRRTLSQRGLRIAGPRVLVSLHDIDEGALDTLWPPHTWRAEDWPQLSSDDAGRAIPDPVGTALKLHCPQLDADTDHDEWVYGVSAGEAVELPVIGLSSAFAYLLVAGDQRGLIAAGGVLYWEAGGQPWAKRYVPASVFYDEVADRTALWVGTQLPAGAVAGGVLRVGPQVLSVYRSGRLVPPAEYDVLHTWEPLALVNGDFAAGTLDGWNVEAAGSGSATVIDGEAVLTSTDAGNYRRITQLVTAPSTLAWAVHVVTGAGAAVELRNPGQDWRRIPANSSRTVLLSNLPGGVAGVSLRVADDTGTARIRAARVLPLPMTVLRFRREQRDFSGALYRIEADVHGPASRNAVREMQRLLTAAGLTVAGAQFDAAATYADSHRMLVDCDHGRTDRRRVRAILDDLAYIARATIRRLADGTYGISQDRATAISATLDTAADPIAIDDVDWAPARPASVAIAYRPGSADPDRMQHEIRRTVAGGTRGDDPPRPVRYLRDHEAADRLLCYLALRATWARRLQVRLLAGAHDHAQLGTGLAITSPELPAPVATTVWRTEQVVAGAHCELVEYDDAIHVYTPGPDLPDAAAAYEPDYSLTPPAAPTALTLTALDSSTASDGRTTARATARATAPAENWSEIWLVAVHNITGELTAARAAPIAPGSSVHEAVLSPLRPGETYQLHGYAISPFGLRGPAVTVFNAGPVGGGATDTTFVAPGAASLPPNVASVQRNQGTGRWVEVSWPAVAGPDIAGYVVERQIGASAWNEIWSGQATSMVDRNVTYGPLYTYRVRARNIWGQHSAAWTQSSNIQLLGNVTGGSGGDIPGGTVATYNRTPTSQVTLTGVSGTVSVGYRALPHGLTKAPMVTVGAEWTHGGPDPDFGIYGIIGVEPNDTNVIVHLFNVFGNPSAPPAMITMRIW